MNETRWTNVQAARSAWERGRDETGPGPIEAFFEIAARCNLRCTMCAINYDSRYLNSSGRPAIFGPDLFERLASAFPTLVRAYLFGLGEPLLNPHLTEYVARLSSLGVEVWFNTNATLIDDEMAERIAAAGADRITVSIDGATRETYERIRRGARFENVLRGISALVAAGRRGGRLKVNLSFVAMKSNIEELPLLVDLCAGLGASGIHVEPLYGQDQEALESHYASENLGTLPPGRVQELFDEARDRAEKHDVALASRFLADQGSYDYRERATRHSADWTCTEPWSSIWVTAAGEVRTCCINETSFGTLHEEPFESIWNGADFRNFRRQHASRTEEPAGCGNCIRNGRVRHSPFFRTVEPVTYRPLKFEAADDPLPVSIDWPHPGEFVTDPWLVTGRVLDPRGRVNWEMMIDREPLDPLDGSCLTSDGSFVVHGPVPFLTEGAHILWFRDKDRKDGRGWGHREIHFRRGETNGEAIAVTSLAALPAVDSTMNVRAWIDGHHWEVRRIERRRPAPPLLILDTSELVPGVHELELRSLLRRPVRHMLDRLSPPLSER